MRRVSGLQLRADEMRDLGAEFAQTGRHPAFLRGAGQLAELDEQRSAGRIDFAKTIVSGFIPSDVFAGETERKRRAIAPFPAVREAGVGRPRKADGSAAAAGRRTAVEVEENGGARTIAPGIVGRAALHVQAVGAQ